MTAKVKRPGRTQVRAENPSGACGNGDHMTMDELKARAVGEILTSAALRAACSI